MRFTRLVAGSYQTETLAGLYLQLLKNKDGWTVSSSTHTEGPFSSMREARSVAMGWDRVRELDDAQLQGHYTLSLATHDDELIDVYNLGGSTGYPLPLRWLGPDSLAGEINDVLKGYEKDHPPANEVPM